MLMQTAPMLLVCKLSTCKLLTFVPCKLYLIFLQTITTFLAKYHLANCHLANCAFLSSVGLCNMVSLLWEQR